MILFDLSLICYELFEWRSRSVCLAPVTEAGDEWKTLLIRLKLSITNLDKQLCLQLQLMALKHATMLTYEGTNNLDSNAWIFPIITYKSTRAYANFVVIEIEMFKLVEARIRVGYVALMFHARIVECESKFSCNVCNQLLINFSPTALTTNKTCKTTDLLHAFLMSSNRIFDRPLQIQCWSYRSKPHPFQLLV